MIYRKRTHMDVTDQHIWEIWEEVKEEAEWLFPQYFEHCEPELYMDNSYTRLGHCWQSIENPYERNVDKRRASGCFIIISSLLGQDYEQIRKTLCHEFGHFVSPKENHSYLWKVRAEKIGERWGYEMTRCSNNETFREAAKEARIDVANRSVYRYRVFCPHCNAEWKYKSNCKTVQYPWLYRCAKCKCDLMSERI